MAQPAKKPAPQQPAAPQPAAPAINHGTTFVPPNPAQPGNNLSGVTPQHILQWLAANAAGNPNLAVIAPLGTCVAPGYLPYTNMAKPGKRATINAAIAQGAPTPQGPSRTLAAYLTIARGNGATGSGLTDLCAALNGGYSPSSRTWGTAYVSLAVVPAPQAPAAA